MVQDNRKWNRVILIFPSQKGKQMQKGAEGLKTNFYSQMFDYSSWVLLLWSEVDQCCQRGGSFNHCYLKMIKLYENRLFKVVYIRITVYMYFSQ